VRFVRAVCDSPLPPEVKESALFNLSTLASPTCFRTADGHFFGWEGCHDGAGCCAGSCTHVWNYETVLPFLFGSLSRSMREVSFLYGTDERGLMSFRTAFPLATQARALAVAAADGQMGALMRLYLDWKLGGDAEWLAKLWPAAKRALAFAWIPGGWDADQDGVMEGCQHNTMDVEYFGPNPQMGIWYLGALLACAEMAGRMGDAAFEDRCRRLYERGRPWLMRYLFNGEYFEQHVRPPKRPEDIAEGLKAGHGSADLSEPDYQLGPGCLTDQLVGQVFAHLSGLNYLLPPENITRTLSAIYKYNFKRGFHDHFNPMRGYALGDESALLMASYPRGNKPRIPFPYADEVMTGFEYTAACGMLLEGMTEPGLACIAAIRDRYDGLKRNPFDEAECGHHDARAMMSWTAVPALTGFRYDADLGHMKWGSLRGPCFWSTGYAWGVLEARDEAESVSVRLEVMGGSINLNTLEIGKAGLLKPDRRLAAGEILEQRIAKRKRSA
jgi:non-lysosomal glucosylceramidase